jgi:hypothetical protein
MNAAEGAIFATASMGAIKVYTSGAAAHWSVRGLSESVIRI